MWWPLLLSSSMLMISIAWSHPPSAPPLELSLLEVEGVTDEDEDGVLRVLLWGLVGGDEVGSGLIWNFRSVVPVALIC